MHAVARIGKEPERMPADPGAARGIAAMPERQPAAGLTSDKARLEARSVCKVFADDPRQALAMLREGATKDEVRERLGCVVGVDDASFAVRPGEIFVVMGLSGSGKSTLVRLLNRLIEPSAGSIMLDGNDLTRMSTRELIAARRRDMSFVFQSFALMPHLTALDNAAFGLAMAGVRRARRREAAMAALEKAGLGAYAERMPHEMSGGMQQRVGLARALAKNPSIMFMDEAFSALDPLIRTEMQDELLRLQGEQERTIVFISHDLDEAMRIGDRIAIMESGRIIQVGTPMAILLEPADDYVRSFFRNVDVGKVLRAGDIVRRDGALAWAAGDDASAVAHLRELDERRGRFAYLVDGDGRYRAVVARDRLADAVRLGRDLGAARMHEVEPVAHDARLAEILRDVARADCPVPVVDDRRRFLGAISRAQLLEVLHRAD